MKIIKLTLDESTGILSATTDVREGVAFSININAVTDGADLTSKINSRVTAIDEEEAIKLQEQQKFNGLKSDLGI